MADKLKGMKEGNVFSRPCPVLRGGGPYLMMIWYYYPHSRKNQIGSPFLGTGSAGGGIPTGKLSSQHVIRTTNELQIKSKLNIDAMNNC